jgi:nicotinamide mononucleotide transporter
MTRWLLEWLSANYIELLGAVLGMAYIIYSIRQSILTWPTGLGTSLLYIIVFFQSKFYADMGLQFYYVFISIYGWYLWSRGNPENNSSSLPVRRITFRWAVYGTVAAFLVFCIIFFLLKFHTDSPVPIMDAATTALSIVATFMLARKILEHWLIWIVVDVVSAGLYVFKGLWPTAVLFLVYTAMAFVGYKKWHNDYQLHLKSP